MCPSSVIVDDPKRALPPDQWPPSNNGGGDGGDGDGRGDAQPPEPGPPVSAARLAVIFVCATAVMLFSAVISALLIMRGSLGEWPPPNYPRVSGALWVSTLLILASSVVGFAATRIREGARRSVLSRRLGATWILGLAFCVSQAVIWQKTTTEGLGLDQSNTFTSLFYMITGLHVLHVLGGMIFLTRSVIEVRSDRDFKDLRAAVANCMLYWHFVGIVWCILFGFIYA